MLIVDCCLVGIYSPCIHVQNVQMIKKGKYGLDGERILGVLYCTFRRDFGSVNVCISVELI